jgi:hypothetical protein
MQARRTLVKLAAISTLSCATVAFAQSPPKPPAKTPAKTPPKTTARATPPPAPAAARIDPFVGVWLLSAEKSKSESGGVPKGFTRTYEDRGNGTIFMTTDVVTAQGTSRSYLVYKRDGKPYPEAAIGVEAIRLVTVTAVDRNTEDLTFTVGGKPAESTIRLSVSPDGRTMTQLLNGKTAQGRAFTNTFIFDKQ